MLRRQVPACNKHLLVLDSDTESDNLSDYLGPRALTRNKKGNDIDEGKEIEWECSKGKRNKKEKIGDGENSVIEQAKKYQEHMKQIPIPPTHGSDVVFITWQGLARSMMEFYGQPLHYLTHVLVKQWDESRIGAEDEDEDKPIINIINPIKAETIIWGMEEVHRRRTSHVHLTSLWLCDPGYHAFVDDVIPPY
ncbi:hypothetical protein ACB094_06G161600 [Castanea mollissima]